VGGRHTGNTPPVLHWNGTAWVKVSAPNAGSLGAILGSVAVGADGMAWAVGDARS
jgi:hypothetical protein